MTGVLSAGRLDQRLFSAARELAALQGEQTRLEWRAFSNHITGQLYYHLASLVLYSAQQVSSRPSSALKFC